MPVFIDTASDLHPFECNGPGRCIHCDRRFTPDHNPQTCALCLTFDDDENEAA